MDDEIKRPVTAVGDRGYWTVRDGEGREVCDCGGSHYTGVMRVAAEVRAKAIAAALNATGPQDEGPYRRTLVRSSRNVECTIEFGGELEPPPNLLAATDAAALDDATAPALEDRAATRTCAGADVVGLVRAYERGVASITLQSVQAQEEAGIRAVLATLGIEVRKDC